MSGDVAGLGALAKALGDELDKHVGWHMHRGVMVSGLIEAVMRSRVIAAAEQRGRETGWDEGHEVCEWPNCLKNHVNPYRERA